MTDLDPFVVRAGLAGLGVTVAAGPLGCLVLWRRMVYVGDATAHASVLGVALALIAGVPVLAGVVLVALAMGGLVARAGGATLQTETLLGVAAHAGLALGLVAIALVPGAWIGLEQYLFGEILAVSWPDVGLIWAGACTVSALLAWRWRGLLTATLSVDLSAAEGGTPAQERLILTLALAVLVAVGIQVVGALLITALLILPAAAARTLARGPEGMVLLAILTGMMSVFGGLWATLQFDIPTGPAIVVVALMLFLACSSAARLKA